MHKLFCPEGSAGSTNATGLGSAYNIIPDLRTTQMELGMSVNLEWKTGIKFTPVI